MCANWYLLLFSTYFAWFQSRIVWFLHTVVLTSCDVHQNQFIESCTSLMWVNRYLHKFLHFLPNFCQTLYMISLYMRLNWYDFNQNQFVESYTSLMDINRNQCFLTNFNITHPVMSPHSIFIYLSLSALKWTVFICPSVSVGHTSFPL